MPNIESLIEGSEELTRVFGYWPSFHDAEVIELNLWRGDVAPGEDRWVFPVLTTKIHLWELTSEVGANGGLISRHHTIATLRFHDVHDFEMYSAFNHQNAILGLSIELGKSGVRQTPLMVDFDPAHGIGASFECYRVEVLEAHLCKQDGELIK